MEKITIITTDQGGGFKAEIKGKPDFYGLGDSTPEAIGRLIFEYPQLFPITIVNAEYYDEGDLSYKDDPNAGSDNARYP